MDATPLIVKLIAIEQSLGKKTVGDTRDLVLQAQDYVLDLERKLLDVLNENERLRQSAQKCQQLTPTRLAELRLPLAPTLPQLPDEPEGCSAVGGL